MTLLVRPGLVQDADALSELASAAYWATYADLVDSSTVETVVAQTCGAASFARLAGRGAPDRLLVAEDDGVLAGFLDVGQEPEGLELRRLYARAGGTSRGVGAALLVALEDLLPSGTTYRIVVVEANVGGLRFWQRHGFVLQGEVDGLAHFAAHRDVRFRPADRSTRLLVLQREVP